MEKNIAYIINGNYKIILYILLSIIILITGSDYGITQSLKKPDYNRSQTYGVCPFLNTTKNKKFDWIADGLAESITSDMKLANYNVVDRINVKDTVKEIGLGQTGLIDGKSAVKSGKMLGATFLVTGSYQIYNNNIRIVSKVIKTETGVISYIAKVTGKMNSIFDLQDTLFSKLFNLKSEGVNLQDISFITKEIKKKPTKKLNAYKYYLLCEEYNFRGANLDDPNTRSYLQKSVKYGMKAIKIDPNMTIAYLKLSHTYAGLSDDYYCKKMLKKAKESFSSETNIITKNLVNANYEIRINKNFSRSIVYYKTVLDYNRSNLEALWQLWGIYRGAWGSTVYSKSKSDMYKDQFIRYHSKSILAKHMKKLSVHDRLR